MRINWGVVILLTLAAGYVALAVYGKYRRLKDELNEKRQEMAGGPPPPQP